jgi:hypothetical protein
VPVVRRSILELGPRARVAFAVVYLVTMVAVIITAQSRPDHVFGFQMFNESSTINIHLFRRAQGRRQLEPLPDGSFSESSHGAVRTFSWYERVHDPVLGKLNTTMHAKYGLAGQLFRLRIALDDFVQRLPDDTETLELVARVETSKNGREPEVVQIVAHKR